jgi:hypothetical protein
MPKNVVSDPITDQEIAFARLIMSGTMNDRSAAEAAGLNPDTAAYTKSKPRVRAYMIEHRAAVNERLVDEEAEALRKRSLGRDRVLDRLWELAMLSPEATRGSIVGQMKAMAMIVAIEGLIPDRRSSSSGTQPATSHVKADIYKSAWSREQQDQPEGEESGDPIAATEAQPAASQVPEPEPASNPAAEPSLTDSLIPQGFNWVPQSAGSALDVVPDTRQPFSIKRSPFNARRR